MDGRCSHVFTYCVATFAQALASCANKASSLPHHREICLSLLCPVAFVDLARLLVIACSGVNGCAHTGTDNHDLQISISCAKVILFHGLDLPGFPAQNLVLELLQLKIVKRGLLQVSTRLQDDYRSPYFQNPCPKH